MTAYFDDKELIALLKKQRRNGFRKVFDRYHRKVYQFAYSFLKDHDMSEEVAQEAFLSFGYTAVDYLRMQKLPLLFTMLAHSHRPLAQMCFFQ